MKEASKTKNYYFFDEAGTPEILGRKGVNLVTKGCSSKVFIVGFISTTDPKAINNAMRTIHDEIVADSYLASIPSISSTRLMFHANKDCAEVREKVFKILHDADFSFQCIVARKKLSIFRSRYDLVPSRLYRDLVSRLLKNRLHLNKEIDCYFSSMQNVIWRESMEETIAQAKDRFHRQWGLDHENSIRVIIQKSSELYALQAVDYMLWAVYRAFEHGDFRYLEYVKEKVELIVDIFDVRTSMYGTYYTKKNPITLEKISPLQD